ncbi:hypothetical protein AMECASPLE_010013 [Ameca splendens]|uniref:Uncharacterized protein n=1 Tax=Ameca splendens TaxID=208324 RepID=A0ABV0Z986_9TELE
MRQYNEDQCQIMCCIHERVCTTLNPSAMGRLSLAFHLKPLSHSAKVINHFPDYSLHFGARQNSPLTSFIYIPLKQYIFMQEILEKEKCLKDLFSETIFLALTNVRNRS